MAPVMKPRHRSDTEPAGTPDHAAWWAGIGAGLATIGITAALLAGGNEAQLGVAIAVAVSLFVYVALVHPRWILGAFAVSLGVVPYMHVPGTEVPALLVLCAGVWLAYLMLPTTRTHWGGVEVAMVLLALVALASVMGSGTSHRALVELIAWLAATSIVIPVRGLSDELRQFMARTFVTAAVVGSGIGLAILLGAPAWFRLALKPLGYDASRNVRAVFGRTVTERLAGTYLEPNLAGLILLVAVLLAAAYLSGRWRVVAISVIGLALLLTLSRAAIGSGMVAALVIFVRSPRSRDALIGLAAGGATLALAVGRIRSRLSSTFGSEDVGFSDRMIALREFPGRMAGHWWWGLGWNRPEFRNSEAAVISNFVANGPLLTVYRGGLLLGAFVVVFGLVVMIHSWRGAGRGFEATALAGATLGIGLVAFQWDFPIVNQAPATALASMLIAMTLAVVRPHDTTVDDA